MKKVYVVSWEYDTGGGFDWYHTAEAADKMFEKEKINCNDINLRAENWTAFRFDVEVGEQATTDEITGAIDADLGFLTEHAFKTFKAEN